MAGYIGNKAVGLNVTTGDILGDVGVGGDATIAGTLGVTGVAATNNIRINGDSGTLFFNRDTSPADIARIQYVNGNPSFDIGADGKNIRITNGGSFAETVRFGTNGNVTIQDGNLVVGTAGHGIDFAAQTATSASGASTTSELLDHYEEGTFTIGMTGATTSRTNAQAIYTKVGNVVTFSYYTLSSSVSSTSGYAVITGLPFTAKNHNSADVPCTIANNTFFGGSATVGQQAFVAKNSTLIYFMNTGTASQASFVNGSSKYLGITGTYQTA